jgi:hypothetical protein
MARFLQIVQIAFFCAIREIRAIRGSGSAIRNRVRRG